MSIIGSVQHDSVSLVITATSILAMLLRWPPIDPPA